jgi:hypothetical protein
MHLVSERHCCSSIQFSIKAKGVFPGLLSFLGRRTDSSKACHLSATRCVLHRAGEIRRRGISYAKVGSPDNCRACRMRCKSELSAVSSLPKLSGGRFLLVPRERTIKFSRPIPRRASVINKLQQALGSRCVVNRTESLVTER